MVQNRQHLQAVIFIYMQPFIELARESWFSSFCLPVAEISACNYRTLLIKL